MQGEHPKNVAEKRLKMLGLETFPVVLPQFLIQNNAVSFGTTHINECDEQESRFAARCDGRTPFREIVSHDRLVGGVAATAPYLAWLKAPLDFGGAAGAGADGAREGWLVVSPHPDDAELALGGTLLKHRDRIRATNLVCFSQLGHTIYPHAFVKPAEVTAVRKDEALLAAAAAGLETEFFDLPEYGLREALTPAKEFDDREKEVREGLKLRLYEAIVRHRPARLFAPASIGDNPDHRLVFDIVLEFVDEDLFPDLEVHFYEDFPYAAAYEEVDDFLSRFEHSYLDVRGWSEDISEQLEEKQILCDIYRTQFKRSLGKCLEEVADRNGAVLAPDRDSAQATERFWTAGIFAVPGMTA